jgi:hypothetical protein
VRTGRHGTSRVESILLLGALALLVACGPVQESPRPSAAGTGPIVACMALPSAECEPLARDVLNVVSQDAPQIVRIEVGPVEKAAQPLQRSLVGAESVIIVLEFAETSPTWLEIDPRTRPPAILRTQPSRIEPATPVSAPLGDAGMQPLLLGTCGLASGIDFDGSWWDPIGEIDAYAPESSGPARGGITLMTANTAIFETESGFRINLVRHLGPKWVAGCG